MARTWPTRGEWKSELAAESPPATAPFIGRRPAFDTLKPNEVAIIAVPRKSLVSAFSREEHLDVLPRQLRYVVHGDGGRLADWLFHVPHVLAA